MKRVLDEDFEINDIPADVMECILMRVCLADWRNLSLVSKKFYNASRRKRCIQRWNWFVSDKNYFQISKLSWFLDITSVCITKYTTIPLLVLHGLVLVAIELRDADLPIDSVEWPTSMTELTIYTKNGFGWNFPIQEFLPRNLKKLFVMSFKFNQPLDALPTQLICLQLTSNCYIHTLDNLPKTLRTLIVDNADVILRTLPDGLLALYLKNLNCLRTNLPTSLQKLIIKEFTDISFSITREKHKSLKRLEIGNIKITF
jgi:hypothetical protein